MIIYNSFFLSKFDEVCTNRVFKKRLKKKPSVNKREGNHFLFVRFQIKRDICTGSCDDYNIENIVEPWLPRCDDCILILHIFLFLLHLFSLLPPPLLLVHNQHCHPCCICCLYRFMFLFFSFVFVVMLFSSIVFNF